MLHALLLKYALLIAPYGLHCEGAAAPKQLCDAESDAAQDHDTSSLIQTKSALLQSEAAPVQTKLNITIRDSPQTRQQHVDSHLQVVLPHKSELKSGVPSFQRFLDAAARWMNVNASDPMLLQYSQNSSTKFDIYSDFQVYVDIVMLWTKRTLMCSVIVFLVVFCWMCGGAEDCMLCCRLLTSLSLKTNMYLLMFLLLALFTFMVMWQVELLRPFLYQAIMIGIFASFVLCCVVVVVRELCTSVRKTAHEAVEFARDLDDKFDDMLDYLGLSDASSEDDVEYDCWGRSTRRPAKKADVLRTRSFKKTSKRPLVGARTSKNRKAKYGYLRTQKPKASSS